MNKLPLAALGAFLITNFLIVVLLRHTIPEIVDLFPDLSTATPYWAPGHAATLYILAPLVITATLIVLLAPGMLVVMAHGNISSPGELVLKGFGASFLIHFCTTSGVKLYAGTPLTPDIFTMLLAGSVVFAYLYLAAMSLNSGKAFRIFSDPDNRNQFYWLFIIPFLMVTALLPVIFWQNLNNDGFEAIEIGRSLTTQILPAFPNVSGTMGLGIGMVPMAYPIHWCIMLFGPIEAAARLPMVFYIVVVFYGLLAFIEYKSPRRMHLAEQATLLLGLAVYVTAMSYNSGYNNYFTDMASPAAFETLTILFIIGSGYFLWSNMPGWFLLFTVLGFLARPTVLLFVVLLGAGIAVSSWREHRTRIPLIGLAIAIWVALLVGYEQMYIASISGETGPGYSSASILDRFQYIRIDDLKRFLYAAIPGGLLAAISLFAFRWQDPLSRCIAIVSAGYFLVFYFPAFTSLHHFVPAMILPLIVLWRLVLWNTDNIAWTGIIGVTAGVCLWLSLPRHFDINRTYREVGGEIQYLIGDLHGNYGEYRAAIAGAGLISRLFPTGWTLDDPSVELVGGLQLLYYAHGKQAPGRDTNYLVQAADSPPPDGFTLIGEEMDSAAYVKDTAKWETARRSPPATGYRSQVYDIPIETLFIHKGVPAGSYNFNLASLPGLWRLFGQ